MSASRAWTRTWITETAVRDIETEAARGDPIETGGVLIGVYTRRRRPWIVEAVVVSSDDTGTHHYVLPEEARPRAVEAARERDQRLGYLGDWHSHPADLGPSNVDRDTMRDMVDDDEGGCDRPVLLIARRHGSGYRLDVRQLVRGRLRRNRVVLAGGLPRGS